ncbi:MAG: DUF6285 domain-containing protein [Chloroflexota bacterium]
MQDRPTANELLEAVVQFLEQEVPPAVREPRLRFGLLVATNVLKIVGREVAAGEGPLVGEWQRLHQLLGQPSPSPRLDGGELRLAIERLNQELCQRIRAGEADEGEWAAAVFAHTWATVVDKLRVTNPHYLTQT